MPLKKGRSKETFSYNMHELRHGAQFARTRRKFGKKRAMKQAEAIAFKEQRRSMRY